MPCGGNKSVPFLLGCLKYRVILVVGGVKYAAPEHLSAFNIVTKDTFL